MRIQVSAEHRTRIRLWRSSDPAVACRLELGHRLGVLDKMTEVASRFTAEELGSSHFWSEENAYEPLLHPRESRGDEAGLNVPLNFFPAQHSAWITSQDARSMLAVALDRGHGVGSLADGQLEVMQHRRGAPYVEDAVAEAMDGEMPIVLDDTERIFTETWLAIGDAPTVNTLRVSMKRRLNHPFAISFGRPTATSAVTAQQPGAFEAVAAGLPPALTLQTLRANDANGTELLLRVAHGYALGSASAPPSLAQPQTLDLPALLRAAGLAHQVVEEVTLTGLAQASDAASARTQWATNGSLLPEGAWRAGPTQDELVGAQAASAKDGTVTIAPLEIRAWLLRLQKEG